MREILFRGKRSDNGEWIHGLLARFNPIFEVANIVSEFEILIPVHTKTVGQFTGLTDKNGKKIFEGDIISYIMPCGASAKGIVNFCEYGSGGTCNVGFNVNWYNRYDTGWLRNDLGFWAKFREIEVIGNIYDNPELLEVE